MIIKNSVVSEDMLDTTIYLNQVKEYNWLAVCTGKSRREIDKNFKCPVEFPFMWL
jgi:hypothetical protein